MFLSSFTDRVSLSSVTVSLTVLWSWEGSRD